MNATIEWIKYELIWNKQWCERTLSWHIISIAYYNSRSDSTQAMPYVDWSVRLNTRPFHITFMFSRDDAFARNANCIEKRTSSNIEYYIHQTATNHNNNPRTQYMPKQSFRFVDAAFANIYRYFTFFLLAHSFCCLFIITNCIGYTSVFFFFITMYAPTTDYEWPIANWHAHQFVIFVVCRWTKFDWNT